VIKLLESEILFENFETYYSGLVPRDSPVLSHNDVQENNILMSSDDNFLLVLIDYEYGGWNPRAYDIAQFINECVVDLAHPGPTGIKYYYNNFPSGEERDELCRYYCEHWHSYYNQESQSFEEFWLVRGPKMMRDLEACILLNCLFWTSLIVMSMRDEDVCKSNKINYSVLEGHSQLSRQFKEELKFI